MSNETLRVSPLGFRLAVQVAKFAGQSAKHVDWLPDLAFALDGYKKTLIKEIHDFLYALEVLDDVTIIVSETGTESYDDYIKIKSGERILTYDLYQMEIDRAVIDDEVRAYLERFARTDDPSC